MARVIAVGAAHHITQRGNARRAVFDTDSDRLAYLGLVQEHSRRHGLAILGYCLMPNHVHLIAVPHREDSMARALHHAHGRYSAYLNSRQSRTGHVWQGRYYSCPMSESHLWAALRYTERNPVRAGMADRPESYAWSSARMHCGGCGMPSVDAFLDLPTWRNRWAPDQWREFLMEGGGVAAVEAIEIRRYTHTGMPLGPPEFIARLERALDRCFHPKPDGRPKKRAT